MMARNKNAEGTTEEIEIQDTEAITESPEQGVEEAASTPPAWDDEEGRRHIVVEGIKIVLALPNMDEQTQGDWEYSRVYVQALKQGLLTRKEWEKLIADRGLILNENVKPDLLNRMREISIELADEEQVSDDRRETLNQELDEVQRRYQQVAMEEDEYFSNTAERKAEQARLVFLAALCTRYDAGEAQVGQRLWDTLDAFRQERRNNLISTVLTHFMTLAYGLPPETADSLG